MEWSRRQTGDRKALNGPPAAAASADGDHRPHPSYRNAQESDSESNETLSRRRVVFAQAQALGEAFAFAFSSSSSSATRDTKPTAATELWSPRGLRRCQSSLSQLTSAGRNHQPLRTAKGSAGTSLSTPTPESYLFSSGPPTSPSRSSPPPSATMMAVNVVPSVVLHFHGFRSSLLSNLTTACYRIFLDVVKKWMKLVLACAATVVAVSCAPVVMFVATVRSVHCFVVYSTYQCVAGAMGVLATFLTTEAIAVVWGNKHSGLYHDEDSETELLYALPASPSLKPAPMAVAVAMPTLPRLNLPASVTVVPDVVKKWMKPVLACATTVVAVSCAPVVMFVATVRSVHCFVIYWTYQCVGGAMGVLATFLTTEAIAVVVGNKHSELFHDEDSETEILYALPVSPPLKPAPMAVAVPTLPRLNLPASITVIPDMADRNVAGEKMLGGDMAMENSAHFLFPRPTGQLLATRRRILANLRQPVVVNGVRGERRRRADVVLYKSKVRVGKAFMDPVAQAASAHNRKVKPVDVYMVRVDCSKPDDKHMNPAVMWDFTATFEEFRKLEMSMRKEMKDKRLRNVAVPHLSSGAILFVQPELTQDVLAKRRERIQKFVTDVCGDAVLADCDAMRKFCQAF